MEACLWRVLSARGYAFIAVYDPIDGVGVYPDTEQHRGLADQVLPISLGSTRTRTSLEGLRECLDRLVRPSDREGNGSGPRRFAFLIDYASRLSQDPERLEAAEHAFFSFAEKLSHKPAFYVPGDPRGVSYNPVIWLADREQDLPRWLTAGNESVRSIAVPLPEKDERRAIAGALGEQHSDFNQLDEKRRNELLATFAATTEGLPAKAMEGISRLASEQGIPFDDIAEAVRGYKFGILENPWRRPGLRDDLANAENVLSDEVKGQPQAVRKATDILKRSATGLSGAQAATEGARPRGVLFFAGPTGVGKTGLARALTQLVFGSKEAYHRFDMSEYSSEHAEARLVGAPPGYVGYSEGGQLTDAVRRKPFSLLLFDEIEKAHPRILDKFLQVLEDGRLTDGRGTTVHFSETLIVFTSNLGAAQLDYEEEPVDLAEPGMAFEEVDKRIRSAISHYFNQRIQRPELLNRLGDNIIVFDFITPEIAPEIFSAQVRNVCGRVFDEYEAELELDPTVRNELLERCTADLTNGGRGIESAVETTLVNPLARAVFDKPPPPGETVRVTALHYEEGNYRLELS
jgi:ATP-dependent Clp protease ATP-binding subunit ClpA